MWVGGWVGRSGEASPLTTEASPHLVVLVGKELSSGGEYTLIVGSRDAQCSLCEWYKFSSCSPANSVVTTDWNCASISERTRTRICEAWESMAPVVG